METRTRVRRRAAGAHRGLAQFFTGFRDAIRRYVPPSLRDSNYRREHFRCSTLVEKYVGVLMNSSIWDRGSPHRKAMLSVFSAHFVEERPQLFRLTACFTAFHSRARHK